MDGIYHTYIKMSIMRVFFVLFFSKQNSKMTSPHIYIFHLTAGMNQNQINQTSTTFLALILGLTIFYDINVMYVL